MLALRAAVAVLAAVAFTLSLLGPAQAATATGLSLSAPGAREGASTTVTARLTTADGAPLAAQPVRIDRYGSGRWTTVATLTTDGQGRVRLPQRLTRWPTSNQVRAVFAGSAAGAASRATTTLPLVRRRAVVGINGPTRLRDGRTGTLTLSLRTGSGTPVAAAVVLQRRVGARWTKVRSVRTSGEGFVGVRVRPGADSVWRARVDATPWLTSGASRRHRIDNVPPGVAVRLPAAAPRPRVALAPQPKAVGSGPHPVVTRIPDGTWNRMTGISWHRGCPIGRAGLRLLRINYWDYDGYRRRGEIVAAAGAIGRMSGALQAMYHQRYPIRSMHLVDRFGYSPRLEGGDDYASMAAGNTSAFNCRDVVGRPGVRSPHSYGRSLDVNPWENPYRSRQGVYPNTWWLSRSHARVAWRSGSHGVVALMRRHGLAWTYGLSDLHHFDARVNGRVLLVPGCVDVVCH